MNTRALYWATKAVVEAIRWLAAFIALMICAFLADDEPWQFRLASTLAFGGMVLWSGADMNRALSKLKTEANREGVIS